MAIDSAGRPSFKLTPRPRMTWRDRILDYRNSLVASPRFQRWAASFPFTRPIARRQARAAFDLCAGFVYSQVLLAAIRLGLLDTLKQGPKSLAELANHMSLSSDAADRLIAATVALKLLEKRGENRFALGMLGAAIASNPGIAAMVEHHSVLYADLADPVALLRGENTDTHLRKYWSYNATNSPAQLSNADVEIYSQLMSQSQTFVAADVLDAYPMARHRRLLDVGGGEGTFLQAAAERAPGLELWLFDLPAVAARAEATFFRYGLSARAKTFGGSFLSDPLPEGADIISLVRVAHDHDDDVVRTLLKAVRTALPDNGTLLIAEPMASTKGAEAMGDAYFGMYLLAMGHGRPRTYEMLSELLFEAGFSAVRRVPTRVPLQTSLIVAQVTANKV